jgi:epoxide hydrolase
LLFSSRALAPHLPPPAPTTLLSLSLTNKHARPKQQKLVAHWRSAFDWRALESRLNARPQFKWAYEGVGIHFFHITRAAAASAPTTSNTSTTAAASQPPSAPTTSNTSTTAAASQPPTLGPLLLLHGWPGSFLEFDAIIDDLLSNGGFQSLVIPSLPGYGFSDAPKTRGWGVRKVAAALHALMTEGLGFAHYNVQGGDWGALIARALGTSHAEGARAVHVNMPVARPALSSPRTLLQALNAPFARYARPFLTKKEAAGLAAGWRYASAESGYFKLQSTRPQTLGYGLSDSPAFLCAWICEKFGAWTDTAGDLPSLPADATPADKAAARASVRAARLLEVFSLDALIGNVALYWFGRTAASSVRLYKETEAGGDVGWLLRRTCVAPTGVLVTPHELFRPPRAWVAAHYNLKRWTEAARGGHFAAMEAPGAFVEDVCAFFAAHGVRAGGGGE